MLRKIPFIRTILKKRRQRKEELWFLTHSNCPECGQVLGYIPDASAPFCKVCGHRIDPDTISKEIEKQVCIWCGLREEDTGFLHHMYKTQKKVSMGLCDRCAVAFGLSILGLHMNDELLKDALIGAYGHIVKEQWKKHAAIKDQEQVQADP